MILFMKYQKYMDLIYYSNDIVRKYPKSERFALVEEIKHTIYAGLRMLMHAIKSYAIPEKLKYLKELDQYVKRVLHIKNYVRYMDDFILLLPDKSSCIKYMDMISKFLNDELHLKLNSKSRYYPNKMGVNFCGYRIFLTHRLLRNSSKKKIKRKVKKWNRLYSNGELDVHHVLQSINSWLGHSSFCNSYTLQKKILGKCNFLLNNSAYMQIYENLLTDIETSNFEKD